MTNETNYFDLKKEKVKQFMGFFKAYADTEITGCIQGEKKRIQGFLLLEST